jgi:hypothetical protein
MTRQTGPGDIHSGYKILLQDFVPGMISGIPQLFIFGCLLGHGSARCLVVIAFSSEHQCRKEHQAHSQ